jgi:hypothetical protein
VMCRGTIRVRGGYLSVGGRLCKRLLRVDCWRAGPRMVAVWGLGSIFSPQRQRVFLGSSRILIGP